MSERRVLGGGRRAKSRLRGLALRAGLDVQSAGPTSSVTALRRRILEERAVDLVIDGGASEGQTGYELRAGGYRGRIVSLEPLTEPFARLAERAAGDPAWDCRRLALGPDAREAQMTVTHNLVSSSLLAVAERHIAAAPRSAMERAETVAVASLDGLADELIGAAAAPYLKLDVQGYELEALRGAERTLPGLVAVEAEVSLVELYEGGTTLPGLFSHLGARGFECVGIFPAFTSGRSGRMMQADAIFEPGG